MNVRGTFDTGRINNISNTNNNKYSNHMELKNSHTQTKRQITNVDIFHSIASTHRMPESDSTFSWSLCAVITRSRDMCVFVNKERCSRHRVYRTLYDSNRHALGAGVIFQRSWVKKILLFYSHTGLHLRFGNSLTHSQIERSSVGFSVLSQHLDNSHARVSHCRTIQSAFVHCFSLHFCTSTAFRVWIFIWWRRSL